MKTQHSIISLKLQMKMMLSLPRYLQTKKSKLERTYGEEKTQIIMQKARESYPDILARIPDFHTPMYDSLIRLASKMAALKKGMNASGISTEEFVRFSIEDTRSKAQKTPAVLRKAGGRLYLSKPVLSYLKGVASSATAHGWPTKLISGKKGDEFAMSLETRNCQMLAFWESVGEGDIAPYCSFFDFTVAEQMQLGIKQLSTIESGVCKYCFYKRGKVEWPEPIQKVMNQTIHN